MKRVIVDYKKLTPEILGMLVDKYPDGYDDDNVIRFKNAKNENIEAVEVRTEDCIYLVKISTRLVTSMAGYDVDHYDDDDLNEPIVDLVIKKSKEEEENEDDDFADEDEYEETEEENED